MTVNYHTFNNYVPYLIALEINGL